MSKYNLDKKDINLENLARKTLSDNKLLDELMKGILSKDNTIRGNSFKILESLSEENPEFLYPHWDNFSKMLKSKNNYHRYIAIYLLANLTAIDVENKFEAIFDEYFLILGGDKAMTASHVALNSSKIALNKPELQEKIIDMLLNIDEIHQGKQTEMIKAYVIEALLGIYSEIEDKERVLEFVKAQLESKSPKTRKTAAKFLDKYN
ncbi:hypothetical protein [Methanobacterium oryzae]|uniref:hypothetical protein n=1 Tax=Methanobacterium oryzae TaxID=69540 RepID=UPI003D2538D3